MLAFAPKAEAFSISPSRFLVTADAGTSQKIAIKITNDQASGLQYSLSVLGASQDNKGYPVFSSGSDDAENWVHPDSQSVSLAPMETKTVSFNISVPKTALPGSHYLGLAVEPANSESGQVSLSGRLVSILTLQIAGKVNESLEVIKWRPAKEFFYGNNWKFELDVENSGDIEVPAACEVSVSDWGGRKLSAQTVPMGNQILAGSLRSLKPAIFASGIKWPGIYQAKAQLIYGKTRQTVFAVADVVYIPLWMIAAGILLILILFALAVRLFRPGRQI